MINSATQGLYEYDVIIVGGSLVGAAVACALGGSTDLRIAVVEPQPPVTPAATAAGKDGFDLRVSAITPASQRILRGVGAWPAIEAARLAPFHHMHVWDAGGNGEIHFDCADLGEPLLGYIIENRVVQHALHARMQALPNIDLYSPARLTKLAWDAAHMQITLEDGRHLSAQLVVGADGANSTVRDKAGISVRGWEYNQRAVVTTVRTERPHQDTAWQRFLPEGPLAFLPLPSGYSSIVWSTTPARAAELLALEEEPFAAALAEAFEHRLGRVLEVGPRASFPLRTLHANAYVRPRLALVGDAAHAIHPLAGQGVNLGFADAACLAEVLIEAIQKRQSLGSIAVLRRYERWRKGENLAMLAAMDGFKRVFGSELPAVRWVRSLGLNLTHAVLPVKNLLMRHAMGLAGEPSRLARGEPLA
ncbi:UbiH/UbiF/VisC/COQ6 family ubiquinone biosynthesis hydroxylase [Ectothiorhodospiraceae bacterium 2226]|nr:UbiH/UbiF/VisC/COQ6 family ubiquinone biosynthesis hydroxylase [Ectothiorhodospiraceae bacterium 2226]